MARYMQDNPRMLVNELNLAAMSDLREMVNGDVARALMRAASDMIRREILIDDENEMNYSGKSTLPALHFSRKDRFKDALDCLRGKVRVLRRIE